MRSGQYYVEMIKNHKRAIRLLSMKFDGLMWSFCSLMIEVVNPKGDRDNVCVEVGQSGTPKLLGPPSFFFFLFLCFFFLLGFEM